ncbi:MAG TPA: double-strand break repair protein AddB [Acetobacteraceae bacterium]|jgi:ATP-dependent helicase/nuclease subunit B|nr:double-strand break repair protein AddB [Acetobacteraceae bacterium]
MNLFAIPPHVPFLDAVAANWLGHAATPLAVADGLILLPTRRAARSLADAFLRVSGGRALLLPRIMALGALDETPLALASALDLPPAVEPAQRLAVLTQMILGLQGHHGAPRTADRAWPLAVELAALMDEAERSGIDLAARLPDAADDRFAAHWAETLTFLAIVTHAWPAWLTEQGLLNPAARQVALLDAQAEAWRAAPPGERVLLAGTTGGIPAVARLARVIAGLPTGAVVLPGLDADMADSAWEALSDSHPQAGLRRLLDGLGATRGDVLPLPQGEGESHVPPARAATISRALLPGQALNDWTGGGTAEIGGLLRLTPADQQEEAAAIALVLREALETRGARAALVTPDRDLAGRVATELARYGVIADDSAGEKLAATPPAVFLRLLAMALAEHLAPVPLLAVLKHPLAGAGLSPAACRAGARALELAALRGPRPGPGLTGLRQGVDRVRADWAHVDRARAGRAGEDRAVEAQARPDRADDRGDPPAAAALLARIETCLEPALRVTAAVEAAPADMLAGLIAAAERLAATDDLPGPSRLWAGEEGEALATALSAVQAALPVLGDQPRGVLPGLLDAVLEGAVVRTRRALRGGAGAEHPRVFIWGLLEARLQSAEVIVLGGLVEGVWPPLVEPGPWLSRPMRSTIGLPSPEEAVGQAAHDFTQAACAAPAVVLSCPRRRDGAPAVPARWLTRLEVFLKGQGIKAGGTNGGAAGGTGLSLPDHPAADWARQLDQPVGGAHPVRPPEPRPAVKLRPRKLSVSEIETWLRDPYAIYARRILRLKPLDPLDQETDAADYGELVHAGLHRFLREHGTAWPPNAAVRLREALGIALAQTAPREALRAWWTPRLDRIADWVAEIEAARRAMVPPTAIVSEARGAWALPRPGGLFELIGRADRIERRIGFGLAILDYKTGTPPSQSEVDAGLAPQLLLEAAMAQAGAFGADLTAPVAELIYWHLSGGFDPGSSTSLFKGNAATIGAAVAEAAAALTRLIDAFDDPARPYLSHPHPGRAPRFADYAQLARVAEWSAAGEGE